MNLAVATSSPAMLRQGGLKIAYLSPIEIDPANHDFPVMV